MIPDVRSLQHEMRKGGYLSDRLIERACGEVGELGLRLRNPERFSHWQDFAAFRRLSKALPVRYRRGSAAAIGRST